MAEIPEDVVTDEPLQHIDDEDEKANSYLPYVEQVSPEQRHTWSVESFKNSSALKLIVFCIILVVGLDVAQTFTIHRNALSASIEMLKTVATVSLGFLFGKSGN